MEVSKKQRQEDNGKRAMTSRERLTRLFNGEDKGREELSEDYRNGSGNRNLLESIKEGFRIAD